MVRIKSTPAVANSPCSAASAATSAVALLVLGIALPVQFFPEAGREQLAQLQGLQLAGEVQAQLLAFKKIGQRLKIDLAGQHAGRHPLALSRRQQFQQLDFSGEWHAGSIFNGMPGR